MNAGFLIDLILIEKDSRILSEKFFVRVNSQFENTFDKNWQNANCERDVNNFNLRAAFTAPSILHFISRAYISPLSSKFILTYDRESDPNAMRNMRSIARRRSPEILESVCVRAKTAVLCQIWILSAVSRSLP